jgi:hypothetical protein
MKKKISRKELQMVSEIITYYLQEIEKLPNKPKLPFEFSYGLSRNESRMEEEVKAVKESSKCLQNKDFREKEYALVLQYCAKDENNKPISKDGLFQFSVANANSYYSDLRKLKTEEFPEILEFEAFLTQEVEIDFFPVKLTPDILKLDVTPSWVKLMSKYLIADEA